MEFKSVSSGDPFSTANALYACIVFFCYEYAYGVAPINTANTNPIWVWWTMEHQIWCSTVHQTHFLKKFCETEYVQNILFFYMGRNICRIFYFLYEKEYTQNILFGIRNCIMGWRGNTVWCDNYYILVLKMSFWGWRLPKWLRWVAEIG